MIIPKFKKGQLVKCIDEGSGHIQDRIYIVLDPDVFTNKADKNRKIIISTNAGWAYESRFILAKEKLPEEWL